MYFEDINFNQNRIIKLQDPIDDNDAATKGYIDLKVANVNLDDYLKRDGSKAMTGNLQMGDHNITGIRSSSQDNAALTMEERNLFIFLLQVIREWKVFLT